MKCNKLCLKVSTHETLWLLSHTSSPDLPLYIFQIISSPASWHKVWFFCPNFFFLLLKRSWNGWKGDNILLPSPSLNTNRYLWVYEPNTRTQIFRFLNSTFLIILSRLQPLQKRQLCYYLKRRVMHFELMWVRVVTINCS